MREYVKRLHLDKADEQTVAQAGTDAALHVPNHAWITSTDSSNRLDDIMQSRIMERFGGNQNPVAEQEADVIATGIRARDPEQVKAELGEQMGADFSNVRFHTGLDAREHADSIGARAYTSGADVYFGSGGFDPQIAAHELVHTVQQGAVDSPMSTVAAPMGGVQMKLHTPGFLKKLFGKQSTPKPDVKQAPGKLDLMSGARSLKTNTVLSANTIQGQKAVIKSTTDPKLESTLADYYNAAGAIRDQEHKSAWSFDTPGARGVRPDEQADVTALYQSGNLENQGRGELKQTTDEGRLNSTTIFTSVGGKSPVDPRERNVPKGALKGLPSKASDYKNMLGYISVMDLIQGNHDRLYGYLNTENWLEERKDKKLHLIDNSFYGLGSLAAGTNADVRQKWQERTLNMLKGGQADAKPSIENFARQSMVDDVIEGKKRTGLFDKKNTVTGALQAVQDLPKIRQALQQSYSSKSANGQLNNYQQELLSRIDWMIATLSDNGA